MLRKLAGIGIVALTTWVSQGALVVNGGFETGDFTGWTQTGNTGFTGVTGTFGGSPFVDPHSGNYQAYFGPVGSPGGISQTLAVTLGQTYQIDFWLYNFGGTPSSVNVMWGSATVLSLVDPGGFEYTHYSATVTATSTTVDFAFQQNPSYFLLDDVSVSAVPEPSTMIAGAMLLLPFGASAVRRFRKK